MKKIELSNLRGFFHGIFSASGLNAENAEIVTDVYMRTTIHNIGHHDIYYLSGRLKGLKENKVKPNPSIQLVKKYEAMESYDGDNGLGEICSSFIMERAKKLADGHGIGFCTIRNSNHFLAAAPYIEKAAEEGYLAMIFSKTAPVMNAPGSTKKIASSCPMGFAAGTNENFPVMLDMCLAYMSMGKMNALAKSNKSIPSHWGMDANGMPTTDPSAVKNGGVSNPIGGHKGFGLSILVEILTGVMSGGVVVDETYPENSGKSGIRSQAAIVLKADGLMTLEEFKSRTSDIINRMQALEPNVHIPGQSSYANKMKIESDGSILLKEEVIDELNQWAKVLNAGLL